MARRKNGRFVKSSTRNASRRTSRRSRRRRRGSSSGGPGIALSSLVGPSILAYRIWKGAPYKRPTGEVARTPGLDFLIDNKLKVFNTELTIPEAIANNLSLSLFGWGLKNQYFGSFVSAGWQPYPAVTFWAPTIAAPLASKLATRVGANRLLGKLQRSTIGTQMVKV